VTETLPSGAESSRAAAMARQQQALQFGLVGLGALTAFAETRGDYFVGAPIFNLVPLA
jgi:hypothetical protein